MFISKDNFKYLRNILQREQANLRIAVSKTSTDQKEFLKDLITAIDENRLKILSENELTDAARKLGAKGGSMRSKVLTPEERSAIAQNAANRRWKH